MTTVVWGLSEVATDTYLLGTHRRETKTDPESGHVTVTDHDEVYHGTQYYQISACATRTDDELNSQTLLLQESHSFYITDDEDYDVEVTSTLTSASQASHSTAFDKVAGETFWSTTAQRLKHTTPGAVVALELDADLLGHHPR